MNKLKIILFVSLALNLLVLGAIGSFIVAGYGKGKFNQTELSEKSGRRGPAMRQAPPVLLWPMLQALNHDERRSFGRDIRKNLNEAGLGRAKGQELELALKESLQTEPFDLQAVRAALSNLQKHGQARSDIVLEQMLTNLSQMSPQQRKEIADRMQRKRQRKR